MAKKKYTIRNKSCNIKISKNTVFGKNVVFGNNCKSICIGHGCFLGNDIYIDVENLEIGDYVTIHHGTTLHGIKTSIGHNCWIGQYCIIDSLGGNTSIGNNVGIGAHSQLWSHMKFGDKMSGCLWNSSGKLELKDEVWLVGHTIIGPITAHKQSMLLTGSVMMKDMIQNKIYAGNPAKIVEKLGAQFKPHSYSEKLTIFNQIINEYKALNKNLSTRKFITVNSFKKELYNEGFTQFKIDTQEYMPIYSEAELNFIKFMLYDKAKFIPFNEN